MYGFQASKDYVPVFYICKEVWGDKYKRVINKCLDERRCHLLIEPSDDTKEYVEIVCESKYDFTSHYELIDKLLGI